MRERPGRVLPSVIVGGLLVSGLALGAGVANAAVGDTCTVNKVSYTIDDAAISKNPTTGECERGGLVSTLLTGLTKVTSAAPVATVPPSVAPAPSTVVSPPVGSPAAPTTTTPTSKASAAPAAGSTTTAAAPAAGPALAPPPPAVAPAIAPAFAGPAGVFSPAAFGGIAPAGLASSLFSANAYDPGLLFGSPLAGAAAQLFSPKADSSVTTASQAQALGADPGNGYGTPATISVIILACLIGFAVRHRVISRMKGRQVGEEYRPRHAAPEAEPEPVEDERTTVLTR